MALTNEQKVARATKRAETQKQKERVQAVTVALADERLRFNHAVADGACAILTTAFGPYRVVSVNQDMWYTTHPLNERRNNFNQRSFCGCNDGTWSVLLKQAGVPRHPLFAND